MVGLKRSYCYSDKEEKNIEEVILDYMINREGFL